MTTSFADYLRLYEESWLKLLQTSPELESYEDRSLYSIWQLFFEQVKRQNEFSANLLQLWAYFDNLDLWLELLQAGSLNGLKWLSQLAQDELSFTQTLRVLYDYGLVEANTFSQESGVESGGYSMHSCVYFWTIHVLNKEWISEMAGIALECVGSHVPSNEKSKYWVTRRRLIRHAAWCWDMMVKGMVEADGIEWVFHSLGLLYADHGKLDEAEKMYQRALQGYEKALGCERVKTYIPALNTMQNLARLYKQSGRAHEAKDVFSRTLDGLEVVLGRPNKRYQDVLTTLAALGGPDHNTASPSQPAS